MQNLMSFFSKSWKKEVKPKVDYVCSAILEDESLVEMVFNQSTLRTQFLVYRNERIERKESIIRLDDSFLFPLPASGNIVKKGLVLFSEEAKEYGSTESLIKEIKGFIHRYTQVSEWFEEIASYYVMLTWIHDRFNELPYLRMFGDWGTGKSRTLKTIACLCNRPIMAGGAVTASPVFRILDQVHGTLVLDEADFRFSDASVEIIKILNCGYEKHSPVLRSEQIGNSFEPRVFDVYGPKILATRGRFQDQALESRCLTEFMKKKTRIDIPLNLPESFWEEACQIRNKLLMWRFKNYYQVVLNPKLEIEGIEPRLNQVFIPLLSIVEDQNARKRLRDFAKWAQTQIGRR